MVSRARRTAAGSQARSRRIRTVAAVRLPEGDPAGRPLERHRARFLPPSRLRPDEAVSLAKRLIPDWTRHPMKKFSEWRPHPWHGLDTGREPPLRVNAYIEITPFDLIKYEVDKPSGYLKVDRPQRTSSQPPSLYGFVPRTYCGAQIAALCPGAERGDGDPLDICVLSERPIQRAEIIVPARVVGGLQLL